MVNSYLFVPGNQQSKIKSALSSNAHALILDLEDSVSNEYKEEARKTIDQMLTNVKTDKQLYIRMNSVQTEFWQEDLSLVNKDYIAGVFVPLVEDGDSLLFLNKILGNKQIIPIIETAKGIVNAELIVKTYPRIKCLAFGALDYCLDLQIPFSSNNPLLHYAKQQLTIISRAYGKASLIDSVYPYFKDEKGLEREVKEAKKFGINAKLCIHPSQITIVNNYLGNSKEELNWAKDVVRLFEQSAEKGIAAIDLDGEMIDYPMYYRALQIIENQN